MIEDLQPVTRASLSDGIVDQILELISRGVLRPGERIPSEKQLCARFGVGRTSVREALRSLAFCGILQSHAGEGTYVFEDSSRYLQRTLRWSLVLDPKTVSDLLETRLMLECQTAALAASRASAEELQAIEQAVAGMQRSITDPRRYLEFDLEFHLAVARASGNPILYRLLTMIRGYMQSWIRSALSSKGSAENTRRAKLSVVEHLAILRALRQGDPENARRAMARHIRSSGKELGGGTVKAARGLPRARTR